MFKGLYFYLASAKYHLKVEEIETLVYTCGGEIMRKIGKLSSKEKEGRNKIAILQSESKKESYE